MSSDKDRDARIAEKSKGNNPEGVTRVRKEYKKERDTMLFAWASIAGADPEPVEIVRDTAGEITGIITMGCADPFDIADPVAAIVLIDSMERPTDKRSLQKKKAASVKYAREFGITHNWRGPR